MNLNMCNYEKKVEEKEQSSVKPVNVSEHDKSTAETSFQTVITCPECKFKKTEILPTEVCQLKYTCTNCNAVLQPKGGDCCVFCSYSDHKCPSMQ
jgi:hypothetical protein